ncbi:hypothetical protein K3740_08670 [Ruegeria conchae]|uniref:hypothetical protein n=1 Tax=Ruegeria conchae TaxID=981384 RepID=UPI0021A96921|nr:hypothetical protein [Ruegeria conchae]UWR04733.1 hypothetical protein K3740_08670 [Ruegeria conchae]
MKQHILKGDQALCKRWRGEGHSLDTVLADDDLVARFDWEGLQFHWRYEEPYCKTCVKHLKADLWRTAQEHCGGGNNTFNIRKAQQWMRAHREASKRMVGAA